MATLAPREITPPPLQAPTAKERKYDRQLRLWAASGQRALEESHVLLIVGDEEQGSNSSVAGAESMKNLILPSIGSFTIADSASVTDADLGINFFLEPDSLHKSRAGEMKRFLCELNPDVTGHALSQRLEQWLPAADSLKAYNLIIVCGSLSLTNLDRICTYSLRNSVPLIQVKSIGFYASFSVQLPRELPIVDTHPDPETIQDLRLLQPWPELESLVDDLGDLSSLNDHDHGHIPYILILLYYLREWKTSHNDTLPSTFKEKTAFRELVRSGARTDNPEGGEENFDEACAAVLKSIAPPHFGCGCKEMMSMPSCTTVHADSANFWLIARAIKSFNDTHGVLPVPGTLPDMKSTSADYIKLQQVYKAKARADVLEVTSLVRQTENKLGRDNLILESEIEAFCKNASHVRVLANFADEPLPIIRLAHSDQKTLSRISSLNNDDFEGLLTIFIALHADLASSQLRGAVLSSLNAEGRENLTKAVEEVRRAQGGELHNISSVIGGMVAQEAIKLITRQYVPVDGTCVFDGIQSKTGFYKI